VCARVGNQRSRGVVTARVRTDTVWSLRHQRRDLHQSIYHIPLRRSGLILLSQEAVKNGEIACVSGWDLSEYDYVSVSKDGIVPVSVKPTNMSRLSRVVLQ
jgi:hypothetical protein